MPSDTESDAAHTTSLENGAHLKAFLAALDQGKEKDPALQPYLKAARWIPLAIHPFACLFNIANLTTVFFSALEEDMGDEDLTQTQEIDKKEELRIYLEIMKLVPTFKEAVAACCGHEGYLTRFVKMLSDAANSARHDDLSKTNNCIPDYLQPTSKDLLQYDRKEFPLPGCTDYANRGWNHPEYAIHLYPKALEDDWSQPEAEMYDLMQELINGGIQISESEWPSFLYPQEATVELDNDANGLLLGYLPLMVFRQIFTGPCTALNPGEKKVGRSCKAQIHNLTSVTGRTIAYACVMTRLALRGLGWSLEDGSFEYAVFYSNIVRVFEDHADTPWVRSLIAHWNKHAPGLPRSTSTGPAKIKPNMTRIPNRPTDPVNRMFAQLEAAAHPAPSEPFVDPRPSRRFRVNPTAAAPLVPPAAAAPLVPLPAAAPLVPAAAAAPLVPAAAAAPLVPAAAAAHLVPPAAAPLVPPAATPLISFPIAANADTGHESDSDLSDVPESPKSARIRIPPRSSMTPEQVTGKRKGDAHSTSAPETVPAKKTKSKAQPQAKTLPQRSAPPRNTRKR